MNLSGCDTLFINALVCVSKYHVVCVWFQCHWFHWWDGMALGFFNLGPRTHMSGQIGVPSIFMRKSDWQITVILLTSLHCLFLLFENINFRQYNALQRSLLWLYVIESNSVKNPKRSHRAYNDWTSSFRVGLFTRRWGIGNPPVHSPTSM